MNTHQTISRLFRLAVSTFLLGSLQLGAADRPNVVLVMTDDQGYGDLRCHGNSMIKTPNLDRLHSQAVRLTDFHVDPTCSPTRAALLTGRYSTRTGVWHTVMGRSILFDDEVTMGQMFAAAGYRTGIFGKWHLGDNYPARPQDRGFQDVFIHGGGGVGQTPDFWGNDYFDDTFLHNGEWRKQSGYCTKVFFDHALEFIEANRKGPFFCYIPTNVPHSPNYVAEKYSQPYRNQGVPERMATFYGMITEFDENMGRLLERLDDLGLSENTILIFMTDNGTAAGVHWHKGKGVPPRWTGFNAEMRGGKGSHWDGGHRVPFFIRWPNGGLRGGRDVQRLTAHIDVLPTLAELCRVAPPMNRNLDGMSLANLLRGAGSDWPDRTLFAHFQREEIPPKWKRSVTMTERWRLIDGEELFDIKADPGQRKNVAPQHGDVVKRLRADYENWWSGLQPRLQKHGWIVLGSEHENPAHITCHDWHIADLAKIPWNQTHVEQGLVGNGYWMVDFSQAGTYEFTLRQKPAIAQFPIEATAASISVGNREALGLVPSGASSVTLTMTVSAGKKRMQATFDNEIDGTSRGAYFVEVRRVN